MFTSQCSSVRVSPSRRTGAQMQHGPLGCHPFLILHLLLCYIITQPSCRGLSSNSDLTSRNQLELATLHAPFCPMSSTVLLMTAL